MLTKLKTLDLSRNPLEDLPPDVFKDVIVSNNFLPLKFLHHILCVGFKSVEMSWMSIAKHQPSTL